MVFNFATLQQDILNGAREGNFECATIMLENARRALKHTDDPALVYLRECLEEYYLGGNLTHAFNLQEPPKGRRRDPSKRMRDIWLDYEVRRLVESEGKTVTRAIELVAVENNVSEATVNKAHYRPRHRKK